MQRSIEDGICVENFKPIFKTAIYNTQVNVVGNHLSGLLVIKTMLDNSIRIVFSSEAGFKFFDFGFSGQDFIVHYIYKKMDKEAIVKTLRKDFQLVLMNKLNTEERYTLKKTDEIFHTFSDENDRYYYVTDSLCTHLIRMERGSRRKKIMEVVVKNFIENVPDTIGITHSNFKFSIGLKRIYNYAER